VKTEEVKQSEHLKTCIRSRYRITSVGPMQIKQASVVRPGN